jgi:hypothetical protein
MIGSHDFTLSWKSDTDSTGPFRDFVISLLASLAQQARMRIQERVRAGLERAKVKGTGSGKAIGRPGSFSTARRPSGYAGKTKAGEQSPANCESTSAPFGGHAESRHINRQLFQNSWEQFRMASDTNKPDVPNREPLPKPDDFGTVGTVVSENSVFRPKPPLLSNGDKNVNLDF